MKRTMIVAASGFAVLAAALFAACKVSASAEAGPGVPLFGGSSVDIEVDGRSVTPQPDPAGGYPKAGDCVKLHFKDGDGKEIGTAEVPAGQDVDAPEGTEGVTWSPCDPPKDPKKKTQSVAWGGAAIVVDDLAVVPFRALPVNTQDGNGRWIDYTVTATDQARAEELAEEFEFLTLEKARPDFVRTYGFSDVQVLRNGSVRFSVLTWTEPTAFSLEWNDTTLARGLASPLVRSSRTAGGWYATSVVVPAGLVNFDQAGLPVTNRARYAVESSEGRVEQTVSVTVTP